MKNEWVAMSHFVIASIYIIFSAIYIIFNIINKPYQNKDTGLNAQIKKITAIVHCDTEKDVQYILIKNYGASVRYNRDGMIAKCSEDLFAIEKKEK